MADSSTLPTVDEAFGPAPPPKTAAQLPTVDEAFPVEQKPLDLPGMAAQQRQAVSDITKAFTGAYSEDMDAVRGEDADEIKQLKQWSGYDQWTAGHKALAQAAKNILIGPSLLNFLQGLHTPAALVSGAGAAVAQAGTAAGAPQLGREAAAYLTEYPGVPEVAEAAHPMSPHDFLEAHSLGVIGPDGEAGWQGTAVPQSAEDIARANADAAKQDAKAGTITITPTGQWQDPGATPVKSADEIARERNAAEAVQASALRGPADAELQAPPDVAAAARRDNPDLFGEYDRLRNQRQQLSNWIEETNNPPDAAIDQAQERIDVTQRAYDAHLQSSGGYTGGAEARRLRADLRMAQGDLAALQERQRAFAEGRAPQTEDLVQARQHLLSTDYALHDLRPQVMAALSDAGERVGAARVEHAPAEPAPGLAAPLQTDVPAIIAAAREQAARRPIVVTPMPTGANSSKDMAGPVYVDPRVPEPLRRPVAVHETVEQALMARGMDYAEAHKHATAAERAAVEAAGMNWEAYTREWDGLLRTIEHERVPADRLPADLHVSPQDALGHHANKAAVEAPATAEASEAAVEQPTEAAAAPELAPAPTPPPPKPIEAQLADIAADVSRDLVRAGVRKDVADIEGVFVAARARLRASLFPDLGTPEEIYQREGAEILRAGQQSAERPRAPPQRTASTAPRSLLQFIAEKGGLKPDAELEAIGLTGAHRVNIPGRAGRFGVVREGGLSLDAMREAAEEAGYLGSAGRTEAGLGNVTTPRDLLDAIDRELRGERVYAMGEESAQTGAEIERAEDEAAYRDEGAQRDEAAPAAEPEYLLAPGERPEDMLFQGDFVGRIKSALRDLISLARDSGHNHLVVEVGRVSQEVVDIVRDHDGVDVAGYTHSVDTSSLRHIESGHSAGRSELSRGQLPVTDGDIIAIPDILARAGEVVTGLKGKRGQKVVGFITRDGNSAVYYIEEVLNRRRRLATLSMRKFPPAIQSSSIVAANEDLYARSTPGGHVRITNLSSGAIANERELEQRGAAPPFYSAVARAVDTAKQDKAPAAQWLGLLRNTSGVKPEEMQWLGLEDWLKGQRRQISRAEIADYIRANQIEVTDVPKGGETYWQVSSAGGPVARIPATERYGSQAEAEAELDRRQRELPEQYHSAAELPVVPTRYHEYTLPGGENYREILLTLPSADRDTVRPDAQALAEHQEEWDRLAAENQRLFQAYSRHGSGPAEREAYMHSQDQFDALRQKMWDETWSRLPAYQRDAYRSGHFDEPNILAHFRVDDRTIDGKRTLFVEEIQSDWHQAGREKGYETGEPLDWKESEVSYHAGKAGKVWSAERNGHRYRVEQDPDGSIFATVSGVDVAGHGQRFVSVDEAKVEAERYISMRGGGPVPDAPFKTSWPELALKRVIRMAAEEGYEQVAWTSGATQNERYGLERHLNRIELTGDPSGQPLLKAYDLRNGHEVIHQRVTRAELPGIIGQELTDRLLAQEPAGEVRHIAPVAAHEMRVTAHEDEWSVVAPDERDVRIGKATVPTEQAAREYAARYFNNRADEINKARGAGLGPLRILSGTDLRVGGEGMRGFYDKILPAAANKLVKKYGARVGRGNLEQYGAAGEFHVEAAGADGYFVYGPTTAAGQLTEWFMTRGEAESRLDELKAGVVPGQVQVHTLPLTDKLKDAAVSEGFPLFQRQRGSFSYVTPEEIAQGRRPIVRIGKAGNISTPAHELGGHQFMFELARDAARDDAPDWLKDDWSEALKWMGADNEDALFARTPAGDFTAAARRAHEKFARGYEAWRMEGIAPSAALARVFHMFSRFLQDLYRGLTGLEGEAGMKIRLTDRMREVYGHLFEQPQDLTWIAPERESEATLGGLHEVDAAASRTEHADTAADRAEAEHEGAYGRDLGGQAGAGQRPGGEVPGGDQVGQAEPAVGGAALGRAAERPGDRGAAQESDRLAGRGPAAAAVSGEAGGGQRPGVTTEPPASANAPFEATGSRYVDKAGNIRLDKYMTERDVLDVIRASAERNNDFLTNRRGRLSIAEQNSLADALGMSTAWLDAKRIGQAFSVEEVIAARKLLVQSATNVRDAMVAAKDGGRDAVLALAEKIAIHEQIQGAVSQATAEAGRALAAFRMRVPGMENVDALNAFLKQNTGRGLFQLEEMAGYGANLKTPSQVSRFVHDTANGKFGDAIRFAYINALISGPVTHLRYGIGNMLQALSSPFITAGGAAAHPLVGRDAADRVYWREVGPQVFGLFQGSREGVQAFLDGWRTGAMPGLGVHGDPYGAARLAPSMTGRLGALVGAPGRAVAAIHAFGIAVRYRQEVNALAVRQAIMEGLRPGSEDFVNRVGYLADRPDADLLTPAQRAQFNALQERVRAGESLNWAEQDQYERLRPVVPKQTIMERAIMTARRDLYMAPADHDSLSAAITRYADRAPAPVSLAVNFAVPFSRISGQMVGRFAEYTPLSLVEGTPLAAFRKQVHDNLTGKNGNAARELQYGKVVFGGALAATVAGAVLSGNMTSDGPSDPGRRKVWLLTHVPHAVNVHGHWISYERLGALGMVMRLTANMVDGLRGYDDDEKQALATTILYSIDRAVLSDTFLPDVKDWVDAMFNDDVNGKRFIVQRLTAPIPALFGQSVGLLEDYQRETQGDTLAQTIFRTAQSKVPLLSEGLPARRDMFGEPIPTSGPAVNYANDPVARRMEALGMKGIKYERKITGVPLTAQQYDDYQRIAGRQIKLRLNNLVTAPRFTSLPKARQIKRINDEIEKGRKEGQQSVQAKYLNTPDDIARKALNAKRKENGLAPIP